MHASPRLRLPQGVTHRDIKPANILLVSPTGQDIKIPTSRRGHLHRHRNHPDPNIGSPAYMSPEQVREQPIDHHTDIYFAGRRDVPVAHRASGPSEAGNNASSPTRSSTTFRRPLQPAPRGPARASTPSCTGDAADVDRYATWMEFSHDLSPRPTATASSPPTASSCPERSSSACAPSRFFRKFQRRGDLGRSSACPKWRNLDIGTVVMKEANPATSCVLVDGRLRVLKQGSPAQHPVAWRLLRRDGPIRRRPRHPHRPSGHQPRPHHPRPRCCAPRQ